MTDLFIGRMSWRRFQVLVLHLPPESASVIATNPEMWDRHDQLLAGIYDLLASANWQRAGKKSAPRPKPLPRPGVKVPGLTRWGTASLSIEEMQTRLDKRNRGGAHGRRTGRRVHQPGPVDEGDREESRP